MKLPKLSERRLKVIRDVCDYRGNHIATLTHRYDGSEDIAKAAAEAIDRHMSLYYPEASDVGSRIVATDEAGDVKWAISPDGRRVTAAGEKDEKAKEGMS